MPLTEQERARLHDSILAAHLRTIDDWLREASEDSGQDADAIYADVVDSYVALLEPDHQGFIPEIRRITGTEQRRQ